MSGVRVCVVIGGHGKIGRSLCTHLSANGCEVFTANPFKSSVHKPTFDSISYAELRNQNKILYFLRSSTDIPSCEIDFQKAVQSSVIDSIDNVSEILNRDDRVIYLSSNNVFDGSAVAPSPGSLTYPKSKYGLVKALAETAFVHFAAAGLAAEVIIVRTSKVLTAYDSLLSRWIVSLKAGENITAFKDRFISPVSVEYLVRKLASFSRSEFGNHRVIHISGTELVSYYTLAQEIARVIGSGTVLEVDSETLSNTHTRNSYYLGTPGTNVFTQALSESVSDLVSHFGDLNGNIS